MPEGSDADSKATEAPMLEIATRSKVLSGCVSHVDVERATRSWTMFRVVRRSNTDLEVIACSLGAQLPKPSPSTATAALLWTEGTEARQSRMLDQWIALSLEATALRQAIASR